ncbi:WD40-repeat-containing domain protein [Xylaria curta]|nr:WD40-repeat-containing domain protein [Xylaria curta]
MAPPHDPQKLNRGYFVYPRSMAEPPALPPGYKWDEQIKKYSPSAYLVLIQTIDIRRNPFKQKDQFYRTGLDRFGHPRKDRSNFNRLTGVFCHRGLYDLAMKVPQNSGIAIDNGLLYNFRLHELDVRMDTSKDPRMAFLAHDESGARDTADCGRWSQDNVSNITKAGLIIRGVNLMTNEFASTFQETEAKVPRLRILEEYNHPHGDSLDDLKIPNFTFQLDLRGNDFATMLAWLRKKDFGTLQVMLKGYNSQYSSGAQLLREVEKSTTEDSGLLIGMLQDREACFTSAAVSVLNNKALSGSEDGTVRIWDLVKGELVATLQGHTGPVTSVANSGTAPSPVLVGYGYRDVGARFNLGASASLDKTVRLWNLDTGKPAGTLRGHSAPVTCVAFGHIISDLLVASGSHDQTVQIHSAVTGTMLQTLRGHTKPVTSVAFANEVSWVASGSEDCTVRIWHTGGKLLHTLRGHTSPVTSVAFCPPVTEPKNTTADAYEAVMGRVLPIAPAINPDKVVAGYEDSTVRVWELPSGELLHLFRGHKMPITSVASRNNGIEIVSASKDKTIKVWDVSKGTLRCTIEGYASPVTSLALYPSYLYGGWQILTASCDKALRIWDFRDEIEEPEKNVSPWGMRAIMVFSPRPIMDIALKGKNLTMNNSTAQQRLESLDYPYLVKVTRSHIDTFLNVSLPRYGQLVPEIVHSGLGLGYDIRRSKAANPKDGSPISDPNVVLASRLDRAMIEVSLDLRKEFPQMVFCSCTRLSDVYMANEQYATTVDTSRLRRKPEGDEGLQARLRAIHGGLYPQSDAVVADDPFAEIAARTWIDEYAKLDRSQLLTMTYDKWLLQAPPEVKEAVDKLNGNFQPNTLKMNVGEDQDGQQKVSISQPSRNQEETKTEGKQRWWKRS